MRTFIALELSAEMKDFLALLQDKLRKAGADVSWVKPHNIHLTLQFLGEIDETHASTVADILDTYAPTIPQFKMSLGHLGAFPRLTSPRVIWIGLHRGENEAVKIAEDLKGYLAELPLLTDERPFSAHITLGRTRSGFNRLELIKQLQITAQDFESDKLACVIDKITLFKSTLASTGPLYEILKEAKLSDLP
jgi:RNA 2',3'-cyclic 3'-phosphodiesterase